MVMTMIPSIMRNKRYRFKNNSPAESKLLKNKIDSEFQFKMVM